jgi:FtsZ-interacting cell division protein ZipA
MERVKRAIAFVGNHQGQTFIVIAIALPLLLFAADSCRQWRHSRSVNKQDAQIQKSIDQNAKSAEASEANANQHRDERQSAEGRAALANEQREQARSNSNLTAEPVRKARQKHEEARKSRPADYPAMSDDELCAELAKRGIACR